MRDMAQVKSAIYKGVRKLDATRTRHKMKHDGGDEFDEEFPEPMEPWEIAEIEASRRRPAANPWEFVCKLRMEGLRQRTMVNPEPPPPKPIRWSRIGVDLQSIHECERVVADLIMHLIAKHGWGEGPRIVKRGWDEAMRVFKPVSGGQTRAERAESKNEELLDIYDLPPPDGGNIQLLARRVAAANKYAAEQRLPQHWRFAQGSQDEAALEQYIKRALRRRGRSATARRGRPRKNAK
jgi:hypothetical protein